MLARRQARTFSTGLICEAWGGSGMSVMLSGTRSALAPCRRGGLGAFGTDGAKDAGPFASGIARRPAGRHALCERHTSIFLPRTASGRSACTLAAKTFKCLPDLRVGFRAGAPKGAETRARQTACLPCVPASSHPSAFQPRVADRHAASRQHRAFPDRGLRGRARQAPQDLPRCSDGANPVAAGSPSRSLRLPTCGRGTLRNQCDCHHTPRGPGIMAPGAGSTEFP